MPAYLGTEDQWPDPPAVKAWRIKTKADGRVAIRAPSGKYKGELASRAKAGGDYKLAPFMVRSADRLQRLQQGFTVAAATAESTAESGAQAVLRLPQTVVRDTLGIPTSVFPWLVGGVAAAYVANAFGIFRRGR